MRHWIGDFVFVVVRRQALQGKVRKHSWSLQSTLRRESSKNFLVSCYYYQQIRSLRQKIVCTGCRTPAESHSSTAAQAASTLNPCTVQRRHRSLWCVVHTAKSIYKHYHQAGGALLRCWTENLPSFGCTQRLPQPPCPSKLGQPTLPLARWYTVSEVELTFVSLHYRGKSSSLLGRWSVAELRDGSVVGHFPRRRLVVWDRLHCNCINCIIISYTSPYLFFYYLLLLLL